MLSFLSGSTWFAIAVAGAAAGPVLIHLLNRRRFRVVHWAAMSFLLEAVQRSRRILRLRDLLLLALRTAAIVLLGLALARPYFAGSGPAVSTSEPVHAILVIDNSLSMGLEKLNGTLLDEARSRARELIEELPDGSRYSVLPACGGEGASRDAYRTKEDARDAVNRIAVVDRGADALAALELAREAAALAPDLPAKRVVLIGDQQAGGWPRDLPPEALAGLGNVQIVATTPDEAQNTWVDDFYLEDNLADVETPAVFVARLRHQGPSPRNNVPVSLAIDGVEVASRIVDLQPDQVREVTFEYRLDVAGEPGRAAFVAAEVSLPPDRLPLDDRRALAVPVVAAMPVVFVDQYGDQEDPARGRYGETRTLRRLLAPAGARRSLASARHVRIEELDEPLLADARLVVIAGVASPQDKVPLLAEFVAQGGQLLIAAGGQFDPAAWNEAAWLDGGGLLPGPLKPQPVGALPEEAEQKAAPFNLSFASLSPEYFHLAGTAREELEELYALPYFFKAVEIDAGQDASDALVAAVRARLADRQAALAEADESIAHLGSRADLSPLDKQTLSGARERRAELLPSWLGWAQADFAEPVLLDADQLAERSRPRVLAAFDNGLPFLVERRIDRGSVLLVSSGAFSSWNTLPKTNAVLIFDRLLRAMLWRTFPSRTVGSPERVTLPIDDRGLSYSLVRPGGVREPLPVEALGSDRFGLNVRALSERGIYTIVATRSDAADPSAAPTKVWQTPLAANGPARESELAYLDAAGLAERLPAGSFHWVGPGESLRLAGAGLGGHELWKWLVGLVLACLLLEFAVLARPILRRSSSDERRGRKPAATATGVATKAASVVRQEAVP